MTEIKKPELSNYQDGITENTNENFSSPDMPNEDAGLMISTNTHTEKPEISPLSYVSTATTATTAGTAKEKLGSKTPVIPSVVYQNLPVFFKNAVNIFEVDRERDIVLTSSLAILSGCFSNVTGRYDRRNFHPNLYSFIIAPPASGKGVMSFAQQLAQKIHDSITFQYEKLRNADEDTNSIQRTHFIPADSSSASVKRILSKNFELGTICETEADTLSGTLLQDWGGYSDLLRKAFQHEPVTYSRNGKDEDIVLHEINRPKLSVCLSGTPGQVPTLLKSTENGLFSRFIFYIFRYSGIPSFKNVFAENDEIDLTVYFEKLSVQVMEYSATVKKFGSIQFSFNINQKIAFQDVFDKNVKRLYLKFGGETQSVVNRLGLIVFRIAMIMSVIRRLDQKKLTSKIVCEEIDFETSIILSEIYLDHAMEVFQLLDQKPSMNRTAELLLNFLPTQFTNSDAFKIGKEYGNICERSVYNYLSELKSSGMINQLKKGDPYFKVELQ